MSDARLSTDTRARLLWERRNARRNKTAAFLDRLTASISDGIKDVRLLYFAFLTFLIYFASVVTGITHLDLLMERKYGFLGHILEVPLPEFIAGSSAALVVFHYQVVRFHDHIFEQIRLGGLYGLGKRLKSAELRSSLIVDAALPLNTRPFWRNGSPALLLLTLGLLPIFLLCMAQARTLALHSVLLTFMLRFLVTCDFLLVVFLVTQVTRSQSRMLFRKILVTLFCVFPLAAWTIFLVPEEKLETTLIRFSDFVGIQVNDASDPSASGTWIGVGPIGCWSRWPSYSFEPSQRPARSVAEPEVTPRPSRESPGIRIWWPTRECEQAARALKFTVAWLATLRVDRNLVLDGAAINGSRLSDLERQIYTNHSSNAALHQEFFPALARLQDVDLRGRDLRFASFRGAFMPRVHLDAGGTTIDLRGAQLQGAQILNWHETGRVSKSSSGEMTVELSKLSNADISGANFQNARFTDVVLSDVAAVAANLAAAQFQGAIVLRGDWRFASLNSTKWTQTHSEGITVRAQLIGADMREANFSASEIHSVDFSPDYRNNFFLPIRLGSTDWSGATLFSGTNFAGAELHGVDFTRLAAFGNVSLAGSSAPYASIPYGMLKDSSLRPSLGMQMYFVFGAPNVPLNLPERYISLKNEAWNSPDRMLGSAVLTNDFKQDLRLARKFLTALRPVGQACSGTYFGQGKDRCEPLSRTQKMHQWATGERLLLLACVEANIDRSFNPDKVTVLSTMYFVPRTATFLDSPSSQGVKSISRFVTELLDSSCSYDVHGQIASRLANGSDIKLALKRLNALSR